MTDNVIINNKNRGVLRLVMLGLLNMFFCSSKQKENKQKEEELQKLAEVITDYILQTDIPYAVMLYPTYPDELIDTLIKDMDAEDQLQFYDKDYLSHKYNPLYVSESYCLEGIIRDMEDIEDMHSMHEYFDTFFGKRYKEKIPECNNMVNILVR